MSILEEFTCNNTVLELISLSIINQLKARDIQTQGGCQRSKMEEARSLKVPKYFRY